MNEIEVINKNKNELLDTKIKTLALSNNVQEFLSNFAKQKIEEIVNTSEQVKTLKKELIKNVNYDKIESIAGAIETLRRCQETDMKLLQYTSQNNNIDAITINEPEKDKKQDKSLIKDLSFESKKKLINILERITKDEK